MMKVGLTAVLCCALGSDLHAQEDDILGLLSDELADVDEEVIATFKSTRLINGHTIETRSKQVLEFVISHRFGPVDSGFDQFWGLDGANIRLGLEYGITNKFNVGVGRSSFNQVYDFFGKYKLVSQSRKAPITTTLFSSFVRRTDNFYESEVGENFKELYRNSYTAQLLLARKFTQALSLQISPTYIHRNYVLNGAEPNGLIALGLGARHKITHRLTINAEYIPTLNRSVTARKDAMAVGVDIETGGHVFQLHFTNAQQINEPGFIGETTRPFSGRGIHFGFNVSRVFNVGSDN